MYLQKSIKFTSIAILSAAALILGYLSLVPTVSAGHAGGLAGYWSFDDDTANPTLDSSGHGNNGVISGAEYAGSGAPVPGSVDSLDFDGSDDVVTITDAAELDIEDAITISFWFLLEGHSADNDWPRVVSKGQSTVTDGAYGVFVKDVTDPHDIGLRFIDQGGITRDIRDVSLPDYGDGAWHHVVVTYSNSDNEGKLYLDNFLETTVTIGGDVKIRTTADDLSIGTGDDDADRHFNGKVDEVRIYDRVLSDAEIALLAASLGGKHFNQYNDGNPVTEWSCDVDNLEEWHFVINQIDSGESVPDSITVAWENGATEEVDLVPLSGKGKKITAHYSTTNNLDSQIVDAVADVDGEWDGNFNLSHGPCGLLEVQKELSPNVGLFDLLIDGDVVESGVGDGGTTETQLVNVGEHEVSEVGAGDTDLASYDSSIECVDDEETVVASTGDGTSLLVDIEPGDDVLCTITNTHTDLVLWLDAGTLGLNDGDPVGLWEDQSGNDNDVSEVAEALQPLFDEDGANGLPSVDFDGLDDRLLATGFPHSDGLTAIFVTGYDTLPSANPGLLHGAPSGQVFGGPSTKSVGMWVNTTDKLWGRIIEADGTVNNLPQNTGFGDTGLHIASLTANTSSNDVEQFVDGTSVGSMSYDGTIKDWSDLGIGRQGSETWDGDIAEVLVFSRALTTAERVAVEAYLSAKYGL